MSEKPIRPKNVAKLIGMSTSALRHYESWGVIPPVPRSTSGYRAYTKAHVAYILALRAMAPGFGLGTAGDTLRDVQHGDISAALWRINEACASIRLEKSVVERTLTALRDVEAAFQTRGSGIHKARTVTIKEAARTAGVTVSVIRYWESFGLLTPLRHEDNGYRMFGQEHVRDVLIVQTMRAANYSLAAIRGVLEQIRHGDFADAIQMAEASIERLNRKNADQMRGIRYLHELLVVLGHSVA